jgi:hypothetical protein
MIQPPGPLDIFITLAFYAFLSACAFVGLCWFLGSL